MAMAMAMAMATAITTATIIAMVVIELLFGQKLNRYSRFKSFMLKEFIFFLNK